MNGGWGRLSVVQAGGDGSRKLSIASARPSLIGDMETYKTALSARSKSSGASIPKGLDVVKTRMDFSLDKHVEIAWNELDKFGRDDVDKRRARRFLRCMGWCGTDLELDAMLYGPDPFGLAGASASADALVPVGFAGRNPRNMTTLHVPGSEASGNQSAPAPLVAVPGSPRKKGIPERFWTLRELCQISQSWSEKRRGNGSVEALAEALSLLAGDKDSIAQKDLQALLASDEIGMGEQAFREMAEILQITNVDPVGCSGLAEKMMNVICRPPSSLELMDVAHTVASMPPPQPSSARTSEAWST